jgi:hypothetical protein
LSILFVAVMMAVSIFLLFPIAKDIYSLTVNGHRIYELPFKASFLFDISYSPLFEIIYLIAVNHAFAPSAAIIGCDGLILGLCAHLAAQLDIISFRLKHMVEDSIKGSKIRKLSKREDEHVYRKLMEVVKLHDEAIEMCETVVDCLWQNNFIYFLCSTFVICILCLMITETEGADVIMFVSYLLAYLSQMFTYSISGAMMIEASTRVASSAYQFEWFRCSPKTRRAILLIITRSQRKVNLRAPFLEVSIETFGLVRIEFLNQWKFD